MCHQQHTHFFIFFFSASRNFNNISTKKTNALWVKALCPIQYLQNFIGICFLHLPWYGGRRFVWNVGIQLTDYTASHPRTQLSSPPWGLQISCFPHLVREGTFFKKEKWHFKVIFQNSSSQNYNWKCIWYKKVYALCSDSISKRILYELGILHF